ncbi:MAG: hypothetical protein MRZ79_10305 [Bacteroidia bacterium]|nr:hypothetical protein [Bacteroidia bacterium]
MGSYYFNSPSKQSIQLFDSSDQLVTELIRETPSSYNTHFKYKGHRYEIANENIWCTRYALRKEGNAIAHTSWTWKGAAFFEVMNSNGEWYCFELKGEGFMDYSQVLIDEHRKKLFRLKPKVDWNYLNYTLSLQDIQADDCPVDFELLLILSLFTNAVSMSWWGVGLKSQKKLETA